MKSVINFFIFLGAISLISSCTTTTGKYEKAISDHVLSSNDARHGIKVKFLDVKKIKEITVADSLAMYRADIDSLKNFLAGWEKKYVKDTVPQQIVGNYYFHPYGKINNDSIRISKLESYIAEDSARINEYSPKNKNEVLITLVDCKFKYLIPKELEKTKDFALMQLFGFNPDAEIQATFILNGDGSRFLGKYNSKTTTLHEREYGIFHVPIDNTPHKAIQL